MKKWKRYKGRFLPLHQEIASGNTLRASST